MCLRLLPDLALILSTRQGGTVVPYDRPLTEELFLPQLWFSCAATSNSKYYFVKSIPGLCLIRTRFPKASRVLQPPQWGRQGEATPYNKTTPHSTAAGHFLNQQMRWKHKTMKIEVWGKKKRFWSPATLLAQNKDGLSSSNKSQHNREKHQSMICQGKTANCWGGPTVKNAGECSGNSTLQWSATVYLFLTFQRGDTIH